MHDDGCCLSSEEYPIRHVGASCLAALMPSIEILNGFIDIATVTNDDGSLADSRSVSGEREPRFYYRMRAAVVTMGTFMLNFLMVMILQAMPIYARG